MQERTGWVPASVGFGAGRGQHILRGLGRAWQQGRLNPNLSLCLRLRIGYNVQYRNSTT